MSNARAIRMQTPENPLSDAPESSQLFSEAGHHCEIRSIRRTLRWNS